MINSIKELTLKYFDIEVKEYPDLEINYCDDEFIPRGRKELDPVVITDSFDWSEDKYNDRNWMFQLHSLRMMDPYLINAVKSLRKGNFKDAIWCAEHGHKILNSWIDFHKNKKSKYQWYDMSVGLRVLRIALLHYIFYFLKDGDREEQYVEILEEHLDNLADESKINKGNHGLFQISALKCAAEVLIKHGGEADFEYYKNASFLADRLMLNHIKGQFTDNGLHVENSPDYHFFVLSKVKSFLACPWWAELCDNQEINALLHKAEILKYWLVDSYGRCLPVGDSSETQRVKDFSDTMWDVDKITYGDYASLCFDGYYQVRGNEEINDSILFFMGAHHSNIHAHDDLQSLIWQENGEYLLVDGGKYGYKSDKYRSYFRSSRAHNVLVLFDENKQEINFSGVKNTIVENGVDSHGWWFVKSRNKVYLGNGSIVKCRDVWFLPKAGIIIVDKVVSTSDLNIQACLNWNFSEKKISQVYNSNGNIEYDVGLLHANFTIDNGTVTNEEVIGEESHEDWAIISKSYLGYQECSKIKLNFEIGDETNVLSSFTLNTVSSDLLNEVIRKTRELKLGGCRL